MSSIQPVANNDSNIRAQPNNNNNNGQSMQRPFYNNPNFRNNYRGRNPNFQSRNQYNQNLNQNFSGQNPNFQHRNPNYQNYPNQNFYNRNSNYNNQNRNFQPRNNFDNFGRGVPRNFNPNYRPSFEHGQNNYRIRFDFNPRPGNNNNNNFNANLVNVIQDLTQKLNDLSTSGNPQNNPNEQCANFRNLNLVPQGLPAGFLANPNPKADYQ